MSALGVELELAVLLAIAISGQSVFAAFEVETPWWRKLLKWTVVSTLTLVLFLAVGHWAILFPLTVAAAGLTFHVWWCRRHGIDPVRARPRRRYYALRGWSWPDS